MELAENVVIAGSTPVIYIKSINAIVFADSHLGFEEEMARHGLYLPNYQLKKLLEVLNRVFREVKPKRIIIAGDVKHCFSSLSRQERYELSELFNYLTSITSEVIVVRGNHDNYLPLIARKYNVEIIRDYIVEKGILITHGHKDMDLDNTDFRVLIMGHEHPSISLRDELGCTVKFSCYLVAPMIDSDRKVIVLPASGVYQSGTSITLDKSNYLSPIIKRYVDLENAKPYIIDEDLGVIELPELKAIQDLIQQYVVQPFLPTPLGQA